MATSEPVFHADDSLQVAEYRTVSALAIVSLVFGLASPLCLAWPLLLAVPLVGAAISIIALMRIDASEGALAGRWAAILGLALCVVSGTAAVSRDVVTRYVRTQQAEEAAREWLERLLQGDTDTAFRLTVAGNRREPPLAEPGMPAPATTPRDDFLAHPIVAELAAAGADARLTLLETPRYEAQARREFMIQQKFLVEPSQAAAETGAHPVEVILTMQRSQLRGERHPRWLVADYEMPESTHEAGHVH